jgi:F-type H+-transporting ATPase subunit alpha
LRQLARGQRVVEVLKQPQFEPLDVAQQVEIIFAVTNGFLDDVPVERIKAWDRGFQEYMSASHPEMADEIRAKKVLSDDLSARLRKAIETYKALHK